jgi:hypothetical protein
VRLFQDHAAAVLMGLTRANTGGSKQTRTADPLLVSPIRPMSPSAASAFLSLSEAYSGPGTYVLCRPVHLMPCSDVKLSVKRKEATAIN